MVQNYVDILQADPWIWNFLCVMAGMVINTIKVCRETNRTLFEYWAAYKGHSVISLLSVWSSYIALMLTNSEASPGEFLAIGYMLDSFLNKAPESKNTVLLREEVEDLRTKKERRSREE